MALQSREPDAYIIDTYKSGGSGRFLAGAILFKGRKRLETIQWKQQDFATQQEANSFVRIQKRLEGLAEMNNEGELIGSFSSNMRSFTGSPLMQVTF